MEYCMKFSIFFEAENQSDAEEKGVAIWNYLRKCEDIEDSEPLEPPVRLED